MRNIALIIDTVDSYGRGLLSGVARFLQSHIDWRIFYEERKSVDTLPGWLTRGTCEGVLARVHDHQKLLLLRQLHVPLVSRGELPHQVKDVTQISADHRAIGRLAAQHLLDRRLSNFAFYGAHGAVFSDLRLEGFRTCLHAGGHDPQVLLEDKWEPIISGYKRHSDSFWRDTELNAWLQQLPKPVGVMACNDYFGRLLLSACQELSIHVPNEVAVIGVDNDEILCNLAVPPLTSVDPAADAIGFCAAETLDGLLQAPGGTAKKVSFPPKGIIARASTNTIAVADKIIIQALQFIRDQAGVCITTEDILEHLAKSSLLVSRSTLERKFQNMLGHAPHDEIVRAKLDYIQRLLLSTDYSLARIADIVGMSSEQQLTQFFGRYRNMTPGAFRRNFGTGKTLSQAV